MWLWSNKSDCYTVPPLSIALCSVLYSSSLQLPLSPCSLRPFSHTPQPQIIITPMREYKWEYVNVNELVLVWLFVVFRRTALFIRGKSMVMDMIEKVNYQTLCLIYEYFHPLVYYSGRYLVFWRKDVGWGMFAAYLIVLMAVWHTFRCLQAVEGGNWPPMMMISKKCSCLIILRISLAGV